MRTFDVTYESVDLELVPERLFGDWPSTSIRLQLDNFAPAALMVTSALLYYFVLVPVVFPATKPQGDEAVAQCKRSRSAHNLMLFLYSGVCCCGTAAWLFHKGELFSWHALLCTPVEGTWLRALSTTFTVSKLVEWIDTAYLVWLGRSEPQFLHKYHHATTFWLFCFVMNLPGPEKFGLLMNGGVHTMMYSHYWRPWPKALVPAITVLQIAQLAVVTYAWTVSPTECPAERWSKAPEEHLLAYLTPYAMVPVFLWLFVVFFVKRFILKKPKGDKAKQ